jgi:energy-converting hydrogenase A subunit M
MTEAKKIDAAIDKVSSVFSNKRKRSGFFLIVSFIVILLLNGLLPVIEGSAHYTVEPVDMTYAEYSELKASDIRYRLTWTSEINMALYIERYINTHPTLPEEDQLLITVPDNFPVQVYTKFFFSHVFWYISTATSLSSAVLLFYSAFNYLLERRKEKDEKYIDLTSKVDKLVDVDVDPNTFEPWMDDVFNRRRKILQHQSNVKADIEKLEKKTDYRIKRKLKAYFEQAEVCRRDSSAEQKDKCIALLTNLGSLTKEEAKYLDKKEKYLSLIEPSYIEQYVVDGKVKYYKQVHPMFVYNGDNSTGYTSDPYSLIKTDVERIGSDATVKVLLTLGLTVMFAILVTVTAIASVGKDPFWIFINIVAKLIPLLIQIPLAIDYTNSFMKGQVMSNLMNRRNIALLYLGREKPKEANVDA